MKPQNIRQIPILNTLRAIAAITVCLHHHLFTTRISISDWNPLRIFEIGNEGVTMFFVISGFVIPYAMFTKGYQLSSIHRFFAKRLMRLEPPYLLSLLLALVFHQIRHLNPYGTGIDKTPSLECALLHLGYWIPFTNGECSWTIGVYWSLAVEFQYYIFLSVAFLLLFKQHWAYRLLAYAIISYSAVGSIFRLNNNFLPSYLPIFMMGISLALYEVKRIKKIELFLVLAGCILTCLYCRPLISTGVATVTFFVIYFFSGYENKYLNFIAKISYSLYLLHTITGDPLLNFLGPRFPGWVGEFVLFPFAFGFSILCAYIFYLIVERPSMKVASRISYHKKDKGLV